MRCRIIQTYQTRRKSVRWLIFSKHSEVDSDERRISSNCQVSWVNCFVDIMRTSIYSWDFLLFSFKHKHTQLLITFVHVYAHFPIDPIHRTIRVLAMTCIDCAPFQSAKAPWWTAVTPSYHVARVATRPSTQQRAGECQKNFFHVYSSFQIILSLFAFVALISW